MPRIAACLLMFPAVLATSPAAHAQACGAVVYSSIALRADLACSAGDGLVIGAGNVRVDLNGFSITSPNTVGTAGIRSSGFSGIKIVGPGRIVGFDTPVMIDGGDHHEIRDIDASMLSSAGSGASLRLRNLSDSVVERNKLGPVDLGSDPGLRASANRISGNESGSIHLHGCQTYKNEIAYNDIRLGSIFMALSVTDGAEDNRIIANRVPGTIYLASNGNLVTGNTIHIQPYASWIWAGVMIAQLPSACAGMALVPTRGNVVRDNGIMGGRMGAFRQGAVKNVVSANKIYGASIVGTNLTQGADDNDVRGNWYSNVPVDVLDMGSGNLWP